MRNEPNAAAPWPPGKSAADVTIEPLLLPDPFDEAKGG